MHRKKSRLEALVARLRARFPKLSQHADVIARWVANQLEKFDAWRSARRPARYVGRHRYSAKRASYSNRLAGLPGIVVRTGRVRRSATTVLRSHMPRAKAKESALRDPRAPKPKTITGIVKREDVELITWVSQMMDHSVLVDQTLRGRNFKYTFKSPNARQSQLINA